MRLDCGSIEERDFSYYSDTNAFDGRSRLLVDSCYLVQHGDDYLLWDAGLPARYANTAVTENTTVMRLTDTVLAQIQRLGVDPRRIKFVGISHYHDDHTGQAMAFPGATLLIGSWDWDIIRTAQPGRFDSAGLAPWIEGAARVDAVSGDRDVFGDGSVVMLATPGHTPGHHSLLVRLRERGAILLIGDAAHSTENYATNGVPSFNVSRADTLASLERLKAIAHNLKAAVIIPHEARDVRKLLPYPRWAR